MGDAAENGTNRTGGGRPPLGRRWSSLDTVMIPTPVQHLPLCSTGSADRSESP
jgi:hypothetical protein